MNLTRLACGTSHWWRTLHARTNGKSLRMSLKCTSTRHRLRPPEEDPPRPELSHSFPYDFIYLQQKQAIISRRFVAVHILNTTLNILNIHMNLITSYLISFFLPSFLMSVFMLMLFVRTMSSIHWWRYACSASWSWAIWRGSGRGWSARGATSRRPICIASGWIWLTTRSIALGGSPTSTIALSTAEGGMGTLATAAAGGTGARAAVVVVVNSNRSVSAIGTLTALRAARLRGV